jgi:hypothetical protein
MNCRNYTGTKVVSFVERFIILCPCLGESTIRGSTSSVLKSPKSLICLQVVGRCLHHFSDLHLCKQIN